MAGLEGTIKTPLGQVQKKTALYLAGGAVLLGGIVWYRQKQSASTATTANPADAEIDPATGFAYGSAEDAAALAQQAAYVTPSVPTGGGAGTAIPSNIGFASNGEWSQAVIQYMISNGTVSDPTQLSAALGKYITGAYATPTDVTLIQQAIAVDGLPPISGPSGYPPSINQTPPTSGGTTTPVTLAQPTGLHASSVSTNRIALDWNDVPHSRGYDVTWTDAQNRVGNGTALTSSFVMSNLPRSERYFIQVRAKPDTGSTTPGPWATRIQVTTHAK